MAAKGVCSPPTAPQGPAPGTSSSSLQSQQLLESFLNSLRERCSPRSSAPRPAGGCVCCPAHGALGQAGCRPQLVIGSSAGSGLWSALGMRSLT